VNVIEASGLGKRYGSTWALRQCTLAIPEGHVAALVGPNGAGKTTLLNLAVGLSMPTAGTVTVLGGTPAGSPAALDGIAFVAQDTPLYKNLSVADMLHLTRNLNRRFDQGYAKTRAWPNLQGAQLVRWKREPGALPAPPRLQPAGHVPAGQPALAIPMDRGRLAAGALPAPHGRGGLAGLPASGLT
jgi:ABC-type sugar transport system ATPase subunit